MSHPWDRLTERERRAVILLLDHHSVDEIAGLLSVRRNAVHRLLQRSLDKLQADGEKRLSTGHTSMDKDVSATDLGRVMEKTHFIQFCRTSLAQTRRYHVPLSLIGLLTPKETPPPDDVVLAIAHRLRATDRLTAADTNLILVAAPRTALPGAKSLMTRLEAILAQAALAYGASAIEATPQESVIETISHLRLMAERTLLDRQSRRIVARGSADLF
jgi:DNA-binding CsgD family transcriptional regulator